MKNTCQEARGKVNAGSAQPEGRNKEPDAGKRAWRLLQAFPASFTLQAAAYVRNLDDSRVLELLALFCHYGLLSFDETAGRYALGGRCLDAAGLVWSPEGETQARLRHAEYYLQMLREADRLHVKGNDGLPRGLALFDQEGDHIRAGQAWTAANATRIAHTQGLCADYVDAGAHCLRLRLRPAEFIAWQNSTLAARRQLGGRLGEGRVLGYLINGYADLGERKKAIGFSAR